jgi:hypothetical protein
MPQWISPVQYSAFENEQQGIDFCKDWGLLSQKASKQKTYRYKAQNIDAACEVIGYTDHVFAVIQMGEQLHTIHPSYLREMQNANFGKARVEEESDSGETESPAAEEAAVEQAEFNVEDKEDKKTTGKKETKDVEKAAEKPAKTAPIALPEGKVSFEATVSEFASVPNPFSDNEDEVVIFGEVSFHNENESVSLESAWSSLSNAFKKLELQVGDQLTFEAKVVAKKLSKHPVKYKINNAAKIAKKDPQ